MKDSYTRDVIQDVLTFEPISRCRWHIRWRSREVIADLTYVSGIQEWRLRPNYRLLSKPGPDYTAKFELGKIPSWIQVMVTEHIHRWALMDATHDLIEQLEARTQALVLGRDYLYESVTTEDGTFMEPDDERQVREFDDLIEANRKAIVRARGKGTIA